MSTTKAWYIRNLSEMEVKGPFPAGQISQEILLGRYTGKDEVSHDKDEWLKIQDIPELFPDVLSEDKASPQDKERLAAARRWADERREVVGEKKRERGQSFYDESEDIQRLHDLVNKGKKKNSSFVSLLQLSVVLMVVLGVIALAFQYSPENKADANCSAPAQHGVDWSGCEFVAMTLPHAKLIAANLMNVDLRQADLAEADLSQANLKYAKLNSTNLQQVNFTQADLKGANLSGANLSAAILDNADLSYADLRSAIIINTRFDGARLDNAIWVDGRICSKGSIGRCN